jgi:predicted ATPase
VQRTLLQQASVVGRVFWDTVIEHLSQMTDYKLNQPEMRQMLVDLREKELIFRSETSSLTNTQEHVFKHALLHEVTYESVLKSIRKNYHALVAQWLIEYSEEQSGNIIGLTAYHMELAGQTAQAIDFYQQAGEQAFARYANEEALHNFDSALKLIDEQDFAALYPILVAKNEIYELTGKKAERVQNQESLQHIINCWADESGEHIKRQAEVLLISSYYGDHSDDIEAKEESIQTAVALAKEYGSLELELKALSYLGNLYWDIAELDKAREMVTTQA